MLRPETHATVLREFAGAELVELDANSPTAYARLLIDEWRRPGDLVIVEQDVVPPPGSIARLFACRFPWCTHSMLHGGELKCDLLGLARFAWGIKALAPHAMEAALLGGVGGWQWPNWRSCDTLLSRWFSPRFGGPHVHQPQAVHLKYEKVPAR